MLTCPACEKDLTATVFVGMTFHGCTHCGGIWFDHHQLAELAQRDPLHLRELDGRFTDHHEGALRPSGERICPRCDIPLIPFQFKHSPGIVLDGCKQCRGIWMDHGELSKIQERLSARARTESSPSAPASPARPRPSGTRTSGILEKIRCRQCGQENMATDHHCWACGAELVKEPGGPTCPRCHTELQPVLRGDREVRCCSQCQGTWLTDDDVKYVLVDHLDTLDQFDPTVGPAEPPMTTSPPQCPEGHGNMLEFEYIALIEDFYNVKTGVMVDRCPRCHGMWFDRGKLRAIGNAIDEWQESRSND